MPLYSPQWPSSSAIGPGPGRRAELGREDDPEGLAAGRRHRTRRPRPPGGSRRPGHQRTRPSRRPRGGPPAWPGSVRRSDTRTARPGDRSAPGRWRSRAANAAVAADRAVGLCQGVAGGRRSRSHGSPRGRPRSMAAASRRAGRHRVGRRSRAQVDPQPATSAHSTRAATIRRASGRDMRVRRPDRVIRFPRSVVPSANGFIGRPAIPPPR